MGNIIVLADKDKSVGYPVTIGDAVVVGDVTLTNKLTNLKTYIDTQDALKLDKSGGVISGNLTVNGSATFKTKVTFPTGGNVGTVLDIPGNLGIGSRTDANVTGRIITERKIANPSGLVVTKSSIGYNPITNTANTTDYGMKYQVQYNNGVDTYDSACFYLSYNGCILGYSGNASNRISKFYTVLHDGNAYLKEEVDTIVNVLREENAALKQQVAVLAVAVESLGVDLAEIEDSLDTPIVFDLADPIAEVQNKDRGMDYDENINLSFE